MRAQLMLLASLLAGCPDRTISGVPVEQGKVETKIIPAIPRRDLDVLFLIDSSGSMVEEQASLKANFGRFISVLESIDGGLPNVHIGVATPDLGTQALDGAAPAVGGCTSTGGQRGALHGIPGGPLFLSDLENTATGGRTRNYTGTLTERFAELADVGTQGCGIEQHLEAVKVALDHNPTNAGFLRDNAYLAVIVIADEDDCSLAQKALFDGNAADPTYGDRVNFRCTRQGIECDSPNVDLETVGPRQDCHPNYASTQLTEIERYVGFLKHLKADPEDVVVAGIVGDAGPFEIVKKDNGTSVLAPSCTYNGAMGPQYAYPALRTLDFLSQFPGRNTHTTICDGDLSAGLTEIGALLKAVVAEPCFEAQLADANPDLPGPQYDCSVSELRHRSGVPDEELRVIGACGAGETPCWRVEEDAAKCSYTKTNPHLKLVIDRGSEPLAADTRIKASCVTTDASGGPVQ